MENEQQTIDQKKCDCGSCWKCRGFFGSKLNTVLLLILIVLMVIAIRIMLQNKEVYFPGIQSSKETLQFGEDKETIEYNKKLNSVYTYTNHGFSIELPKDFIPKEEQSEGGPSTIISLPSNTSIVYVTNTDFWEKNNFTSIEEGSICEKGTISIGNKIFKICKDSYSSNPEFYWLKVGNIGYEVHGNVNNFKTFKFIGWN
jgi:hypothetical protein